jgi:hypothetical protein
VEPGFGHACAALGSLLEHDAPLANAITAEEYRELCREASVMWVLPESSADLLRPVFADGDSLVLLDDRAVADELVGLLQR